MADQQQVFRFKFDDQMVQSLFNFAKIHQHTERKSYKEAWESWVKENRDEIDREEQRLKSLGYQGDVITKMYKSARYYFRTKSVTKEKPKERRKYIAANTDIIVLMDDHISDNIQKSDYRPSTGYDDFCKNHVDIIRQTVQDFIQSGLTDTTEISNKIKKTYKNRYFQYIKNQA